MSGGGNDWRPGKSRRFYFPFSICHFSFFIGRRLKPFLFRDAVFRGKLEMTNGKWKMENGNWSPLASTSLFAGSNQRCDRTEIPDGRTTLGVNAVVAKLCEANRGRQPIERFAG